MTLRLRRNQWDQATRLAEDVQEFIENNRLLASFVFPTEAGPIEVTADARRRNITCALSLSAPLNRQRYGARVRWLLNQLPEEISLPVRLNLIWERGLRSEAPLSSFRDDLNAARLDSPSGPRSFEIVSVTDLAGRLAGSRTFIAGLEHALSEFHDNVARHLRPWRAPTSPVTEDEGAAADALERSDDERTEDESAPAGDTLQHSRENGRSSKQRKVTQSGVFDGKSFSIFDDGSIETTSGVQQFKDFAALRAAAEAKNGHAGIE